MSPDEGPSLEVVQLHFQLQLADLVSTSFETVLDAAVGSGPGNLLFNTRLIEDPDFQRVAAVAFPSGDIGVVFLSHNGLSVSVEDARDCDHPVVRRELADL